jgi:hypothetical protein
MLPVPHSRAGRSLVHDIDAEHVEALDLVYNLWRDNPDFNQNTPPPGLYHTDERVGQMLGEWLTSKNYDVRFNATIIQDIKDIQESLKVSGGALPEDRSPLLTNLAYWHMRKKIDEDRRRDRDHLLGAQNPRMQKKPSRAVSAVSEPGLTIPVSEHPSSTMVHGRLYETPPQAWRGEEDRIGEGPRETPGGVVYPPTGVYHMSVPTPSEEQLLHGVRRRRHSIGGGRKRRKRKSKKRKSKTKRRSKRRSKRV